MSVDDLAKVGTAVFQITSALLILIGLVKRRDIGLWWRDRSALLQANTSLSARVAEAETHAKAASGAVAAQAATIDAQRDLIADLDRRLRLREDASEQYDALVDWVPRMLEYVVHLEQQLVRAGVVRQQKMPEVPEVLRDRIHIPEPLERQAP